MFTIGYRSGPEFFASLSLRTLAQVVMALVLGATGLVLVLIFAFTFKLDPGTAAGLASGSLTQSSMIGTASGALAQLGLPEKVLNQQLANIAAGYAVTYVLGYILTLLFVPFVAPKLMGDQSEGGGGQARGRTVRRCAAEERESGYRKFQARAYRVSIRGPHGQGESRTDRPPDRGRAHRAQWRRCRAEDGYRARGRR